MYCFVHGFSCLLPRRAFIVQTFSSTLSWPTLMTSSGHTDTQAPQPLQASLTTLGTGIRPELKVKPMASASHASPQLLQYTPFIPRHSCPMVAMWCHGTGA